MSIWRTRPAAPRQRMQHRNDSASWHVCAMYSRFQQSSRCSSWHSTPLRSGGKIIYAVTLAGRASSGGCRSMVQLCHIGTIDSQRPPSQCFASIGMKLMGCKQLPIHRFHGKLADFHFAPWEPRSLEHTSLHFAQATSLTHLHLTAPSLHVIGQRGWCRSLI